MTLPLIHLGGTSAASLRDATERAIDALEVARRAFREIDPNARDYATLVHFDAAVTEHIEKIEALQSVADHLDRLIAHIDEWQCRSAA